jgi:hypothetical protein
MVSPIARRDTRRGIIALCAAQDKVAWPSGYCRLRTSTLISRSMLATQLTLEIELKRFAVPERGTAVQCLECCSRASRYVPQKVFNWAAVPLKMSRSQAPIPLTLWGSGPTPPSVYCHNVNLPKQGGTTGVGPYWASQNQQFLRTGSIVDPKARLMACPL